MQKGRQISYLIQNLCLHAWQKYTEKYFTKSVAKHVEQDHLIIKSDRLIDKV